MRFFSQKSGFLFLGLKIRDLFQWPLELQAQVFHQFHFPEYSLLLNQLQIICRKSDSLKLQAAKIRKNTGSIFYPELLCQKAKLNTWKKYFQRLVVFQPKTKQKTKNHFPDEYHLHRFFLSEQKLMLYLYRISVPGYYQAMNA